MVASSHTKVVFGVNELAVSVTDVVAQVNTGGVLIAMSGVTMFWVTVVDVVAVQPFVLSVTVML